MPQLLSLSRAARLAGISRGELQHRIRHHGVATFEGKIPVEDLLQLYPQVDLDRDPVLERLEHIKATAKPKSRYSDGGLPEPNVLVSRLHELKRVLLKTKATLNTSEKLLHDIRDRLSGNLTGNAAAEIVGWIDQALSKQPSPDLDAQLFAKDMFLKVMTASVKVQPSGHDFFIDGNETILQAGLRAGLHLDYGCSSGNCGACKARVISGEVQKLKDHDFVLSEREHAQGYILACSWTAITDVELEAEEACSTADLPRQDIRTKVTKVEYIGDDAVILHLRTPRTQTLRFMAGQNARLTDEEGNSGEYPIASCPCDGRNLEFLIRRQEDPFARSVLERNIKAQAVRVFGPSGEFVLREESSNPAVFVAYGTGFAPIKSLVEQAISIETSEFLYLYRIDKPVPHSRLDNLCRAWHDSLDNFKFTLMDQGPSVDEVISLLKKDLEDPNVYDIYIAGHQEEVVDFMAAAGASGFDTDKIRATSVN